MWIISLDFVQRSDQVILDKRRRLITVNGDLMIKSIEQVMSEALWEKNLVGY